MPVLTNSERLILANQYRILNLLEPDSCHERNIEILERGYEYDYDSFLTGHDDHLSEEECIFVRKVLGMFLDLKITLNTMAPNVPEDSYMLEFTGFDGNDDREGGYLSYTRFIMSDPSQFQELQKAYSDYNSHMGRASQYREMLKRYSALDPDDFGRRTPEDLAHLVGK